MLHRDALIADYGPHFLGHVFKVDNGIVCVVPVQVNRRPEAQASMREMVRALGSDCGSCRNCPVGKAS